MIVCLTFLLRLILNNLWKLFIEWTKEIVEKGGYYVLPVKDNQRELRK